MRDEGNRPKGVGMLRHRNRVLHTKEFLHNPQKCKCPFYLRKRMKIVCHMSGKCQRLYFLVLPCVIISNLYGFPANTAPVYTSHMEKKYGNYSDIYQVLCVHFRRLRLQCPSINGMHFNTETSK